MTATKAPQNDALEALKVDTPGGRIHVHWDHQARAIPNAPANADVLGTWLLAILAGHKRYAHITGLRGDGVSAQILGMEKIISEDALRRAIACLSEPQGQTWLRTHLLGSIQAAQPPIRTR